MSERSHALAAALAIVLLGGTTRALEAQAPVDLSGTWVLNVEESDDLQEEHRRWVQARRHDRTWTLRT